MDVGNYEDNVNAISYVLQFSISTALQREGYINTDSLPPSLFRTFVSCTWLREADEL